MIPSVPVRHLCAVAVLVFGLTCTILLCALNMEAGADTAPRPQIRSGAEIDYPPFSFVDSNGQATGFSVELLRAALAAMGRDVFYRTGPWAQVRGWLEDGEIQALPLVGRTPEREALYDFTFPYMTLHGAIVVRRGTENISGMNDLKGRTVAVMKGDNAEEFLRRQDRGISIYTTSTFDEALRELADGRFDAVVIQRLLALRLIRESGLTNLQIVTRPLEDFRQDFCFAVKKGDSKTLALLNEGLALIMADGTYSRLHAKWFAPSEPPTERRLVIGGNSNFPPFEYLDENGRPAGYNVELTRAIAKAVGLNVEIRLGSWEQVREDLARGKLDALQGMIYSPQRDLTFDFTAPHIVLQFVGVVRQANGPAPSNLSELSGKNIVVQKSGMIEELLLQNGFSRNRVSVADSQEQALKELVEGKHDTALVSRMSALYLMEKNGWHDLVLSSKPIFSLDYCYAVPQNHKALLAQLSGGLKVLEASGQYRGIYQKWMGIYDRQSLSFDAVLRYAAWVVVPLATLSLIFSLWNWSLRKQVAQKTRQLKHSEELQRTLITCSPVALLSCDPQGRVFTWNAAAESIFGWTAGEVVGQPVPFIADDQREAYDGLRKHLAEGQSVVGMEVVRLRKDGSRFFGSLSAAPMRDDDGNLIGTMEAIEDITNRKSAEEELRRSRELLAEAEALSHTGAWEWDLSSGKWSFSDEWLKIHGCRDNNLTEGELMTIAHPEDRDAIASSMDSVRKGLAPYEMEHRIVRRDDGRVRVVHASGRFVRAETGAVVKVYGFAQDITERKLAEDALQESEQRVRRKLESVLSPEGDLGLMELVDLIDVPALQTLMEDFYALTRIPMSIIDIKGQVLVGVGWQDICTQFHRVHPDTLQHCIKSDTQLSSGLAAGESRLYKCQNSLWDMATPIMVGGQHVGNVFTGQFFFDDEVIDKSIFRAQAKKYGFDEKQYLSALDRVPRLSRETVNRGMSFFLQLAATLSQLGFSNVKLARLLSERKRLNAVLQVNEERFRRILSTETVGVLFFTLDGRIVDANATFERMCGYTVEELREVDWKTMTPQEFMGITMLSAQNLVLHGKTAAYEKQYIRKDGTRWYGLFAPILLFDSGQASECVEFIIDITDRKQAEMALRDSETRYRELVQNANSAIIRWSADGTITFFNEYAQELFGWKAEDVAGRHVSVLVPDKESTGADLTGLVRDIVEQPEKYVNNINENICRDGRRVWMTWTNRPVRDEQGQVSEILAVGSDITALKHAEAALRNSEEHLQRAQEIAHLGSWELDSRTNELIWTDEVYRIFGLQDQRSGANYETILDAVHPADRQKVDEAYSGSLRENRNHYEIEYRVVRPGGEIRHVYEKCEHNRDHSGKHIRSVCMVHDITEKKKIEEELRRSNLELEQFAYAASHDLQAPLRSVVGFLQLLHSRYRDRLDEKGLEFIERAVKAGHQMESLIQDLLTLSRVSSKGATFTSTDLNHTIQKVLEGLQFLIKERNARVICDTLPSLAVDDSQMQRLFQNLIVNGLKYNKAPTPVVEIGCREQGGFYDFSVKDNGIGILPKFHERIFVIFQRLHTEKEYSGTGMGLALCKKIVERHGGSIWVESQTDKGSTFHFTLPKER